MSPHCEVNKHLKMIIWDVCDAIFCYLCRKQLESTSFVCQQEENCLITIKAGPILRMKKTTLENAKIFLKVEQIEFQQIGEFANFHGI